MVDKGTFVPRVVCPGVVKIDQVVVYKSYGRNMPLTAVQLET